MKYEGQLQELKQNLSQLQNILVVLPSTLSEDKLAAGLALYLALKKANKSVSIASEASLTVANSNLFGVGEIKNQFPQPKSGDMVLKLKNVVIAEGVDKGVVPALERLDWFPEGSDLNLVFKVLPGQRFEPTGVVTEYSGGKFDMIVAIGAESWQSLGQIYLANMGYFQGVRTMDIDNSSSNSNFGSVNIVDSSVPSVSAMVVQVIADLGLGIDSDIATNLLSGMYSATSNLTANMNPEMFMAVGLAMQSGGKIPQPVAASQVASAPALGVEPMTPVSSTGQGGFSFQQPSAPLQSSVMADVGTQPNVSQPPAQPPMNPASNLANNPFLQAPPQFGSSYSATYNPSSNPSGLGFNQPSIFQSSPASSFGGSTTVTPPASESAQTFGQTTSFSQADSIPQTPVTPPAATPQMSFPPIVSGEKEVSPSTPQEQTFETEGESFNPAPDWLTPKVYKGSGGLG